MIKSIIKIADRLKENTDKLPVVYIAGKVTGLDYNEVYAKFKVKQIELEDKGFFVLNPCDLVSQDLNSWGREMRVAIVALVCSAFICLLPCWIHSKGAKLERSLALVLGINTIDE